MSQPLNPQQRMMFSLRLPIQRQSTWKLAILETLSQSWRIGEKTTSGRMVGHLDISTAMHSPTATHFPVRLWPEGCVWLSLIGCLPPVAAQHSRQDNLPEATSPDAASHDHAEDLPGRADPASPSRSASASERTELAPKREPDSNPCWFGLHIKC